MKRPVVLIKMLYNSALYWQYRVTTDLIREISIQNSMHFSSCHLWKLVKKMNYNNIEHLFHIMEKPQCLENTFTAQKCTLTTVPLSISNFKKHRKKALQSMQLCYKGGLTVQCGLVLLMGTPSFLQVALGSGWPTGGLQFNTATSPTATSTSQGCTRKSSRRAERTHRGRPFINSGFETSWCTRP